VDVIIDEKLQNSKPVKIDDNEYIEFIEHES
jgi:hypothetical protein